MGFAEREWNEVRLWDCILTLLQGLGQVPSCPRASVSPSVQEGQYRSSLMAMNNIL